MRTGPDFNYSLAEGTIDEQAERLIPENHINLVITRPPTRIDQQNVASQLKRVLKDEGVIYLVIRDDSHHLVEELGDEFSITNRIKINHKNFDANEWIIKLERAEEEPSTVEIDLEQPDHPKSDVHTRPLEFDIVEECFNRFGVDKTHTILDPFMGVGTTGKFACEVGCEYYGITLDPAYIETANNWFRNS